MDRYTLMKYIFGLGWWLLPVLLFAQEPIPAPRPLPPGPMRPVQLPAPRPVSPPPGNPPTPPAPLNPALLDNGLLAKPPAKVDPQEIQRLLKRLKAERHALNAERTAATQALADDESSDERMAQLRLRLGAYLSKLAAQRFPEKLRAAAQAAGPGLPPPTWPPGQAASKPEKAPTAPSRPPVDPVALGRTLFRARDFTGALQAFRQVNLTGLKPEERRPIEYLIATCLKHLGKLDEAAVIYREVASSKGDEILADCARWQLSTLKWQRDLDRQVHELNQHLQSLENKP